MLFRSMCGDLSVPASSTPQHQAATTEIYTLSLHDALPICRFYSMILQKRATRYESVLQVRAYPLPILNWRGRPNSLHAGIMCRLIGCPG